MESRKYSIEENTRKKNSRINLNDIANTILFLAVFVGIWQLTFILGIWPKVALPSPAMVAQSFAELNFSLLTNIAMTMWRLLIGFSISIVLGIAIGLAMVKFKDFGKTMSSFAVGLQSFPSIAWV
ncbi:MAG TPA: ABC transporter permease, partial [Candidatus Bathyarchaeia archaeon]|nr:ABC transporter permease [Candidatus Bathyarchaeia archaeon]